MSNTFNCLKMFGNKLKHKKVKIPDPISRVSKHIHYIVKLVKQIETG